MKIIKSKRKRISKKLKKFLKDNQLENIYIDLKTSTNGNNFFDFSYTDKSKISYLKGDRIPQESHLIFNKDYRQSKAYHGKIGKLLSDNISQNDMQRISALLHNRAFKDKFKFQVTSDIVYYYHHSRYSKDFSGGELYNSCMRYDQCQDYIQAYESMGSDTVQLLILLDDDGMLLGRALLWHKVKYANQDIKEGTKYMDRVFAVNDNIAQMFYSYAENSGFRHYKQCKDYMYINTIIDDDIPLPYFDTFRYYDYDNLNNESGDYCLESTSGECLGYNNSYSCYECGSSYHEDDVCYSEVINGYLCDDCGVYIESKEDVYPEKDCIYINNTWYLKNEDCIIQIEGKYYHIESEDVVYSEYYNEYLLYDDSVYSESEGDYFYHDDTDIVKIDDDYYLKSNHNIIYIKNQNKYFHIDSEDIIFNDSTGEYEYKIKQYELIVI